MFPNKQAHFIFNSFTGSLTTLVLAGALVLAGCDSNAVTASEAEIAEVVITPDSAAIAVGERVDFSFAALSATGDTVRDAELEIEWVSTDPAVFTVEAGGLATGQGPGTAFCTVEVTTLRANFTGKDSAFVLVF